MIEHLDDLAIHAKTSDQAFRALVDELRSFINAIAKKYSVSWGVDLDEVRQWVRLEIWSAVKSFEPNGIPFLKFCGMTVVNHIKTRVYRSAYGRKSRFNSQCVRMDFKDVQEDETGRYWVFQLPRSASTETKALRKESLQNLDRYLNDESFSLLERRCMQLYYFQDYSYADIQNMLQLKTTKPIDNALNRVKKKIAKNERLYEVYRDLQATWN